MQKPKARSGETLLLSDCLINHQESDQGDRPKSGLKSSRKHTATISLVVKSGVSHPGADRKGQPRGRNYQTAILALVRNDYSIPNP